MESSRFCDADTTYMPYVTIKGNPGHHELKVNYTDMT